MSDSLHARLRQTESTTTTNASGSNVIRANLVQGQNVIVGTPGTERSATTEVKGIIRIATQEEANAGTDNSLAITPYTLHNIVEGLEIDLSGQIEEVDDRVTTVNQILDTYGNIVTHDVNEFATYAQGLLANTALQPNDNISELTNDVGYITGITSGDVTTALGYTPYDSSNPEGFITSNDVGNGTITIQQNGTTVKTFTLNQSNNDTVNITVPTNASDINAVPTSRTVNGKALTNDITLNASDVGALSDSITIDDLTTTEQLNAINSGITSSDVTQISTNTNSISDIEDLIPSQATSSNQLADKDFVNSSIASNTANFIGTFNSVAELEAYSGPLTNNDYAFVIVTDSAGNTAYDRYKYNADQDEWLFEYELNNSSFTADQWAAINSGITSGDVALINSAVQPSDLATVATSGSYNDLTNKPTIPTVNNATLTIQKNGTNVQTFTANASSDAIANILVPTATSDLTNDSGFITSSALDPYVLSVDLSEVATSGDYDDLTNKPTIPTVNNPTITLTQGGTTKGTFTLNQNNNATIDFDNSGASSVSQLTDVELTDLTNGQGLLYNSTTQKWENADIQGGGGDITDVQVDGVSVVTNTVANITGLQPLLTDENAGDNIEIANGEGGDETVSGNGTIVLENAMADGLNSVTVSGGLKRSLLPSGYTQYDYITATGTQYFVTDYYPSNITEVKTKTFVHKQPTSPMVTRWTGSPTNDTFGFYMGNVSGRLTFFFGTYSDTKYLNVENVKTNIEHDIYMGVSSITFDGTSYPITRGTFTSTQPIYIGAFNQTGTSLAGVMYGRIYPVQFIENGQVVRHYIPCANENNVVGLYEVVTGTFLENVGTGTLKKGRPYIGIDTIPDTYTRLDFLQATGTQYIDSGVVANFANNKIEQTATVQYTTSNTSRELMGTNGYGFWGKNASNKIEAALGQTTVTDNALVKNVISWTTNPDGNTLTLNVNSNQYSSTASTFVDADYAYYVFALGIRVDSGASASFLCHAKVWDYTIAVDDEVVCYLVPVRRNSDNVLGMYDVVTGTFNTNAGTGTFTAGSDVALPSPTNPLPIVCNNGELSYIPSIADFSSGLIKRSTNTVVTMTGTKDSITYTFGSSSGYVGKVFPVTVGRTYTVSYNELTTSSGTNSVKVRFVELNSDVSVIDNNYGTDITSPYTFTATKSYVGLWICYPYTVTGNITINVKGFSLAEGAKQTGTVYADGITETITDSANNSATAEMLLSIGNYTDTQEILTGAVTRKVGVKVFDGTENWELHNNISNTYRLDDVFTDLAQGVPILQSAYCTHFNITNLLATNDFTQGLFRWGAVSDGTVVTVTSGTRLYMCFGFGTVAEVKQYLAQQYANGTPVIVVYPLATPTTETVTGQTLTTVQGDNTLTITQASINNLPISANFDQRGGTLISFTNDTGYITSASVGTLTDVSLDNLSSGQGLLYNSTTQKWENATIQGGGGTVDQTYNPTSANAQSGVAIAGAGFATTDDILSQESVPSSKLFSNESANGYIETVGSYTLSNINKVDVIQKCGSSGSNYFTAVNSPFLVLYKDANNYFGIERQGYKLRLTNVVNGTAVNTEEWATGVTSMNTYLNIYLSLDLLNKTMKVVGSNGTPTTVMTFDFSSWNISLDTFKIRTSGGKYAGNQYNVYLRLNDYYDYESILNQKFQVNQYNTLPILADGEGNYTPTTLYIEGSNIVTTTDTHKSADVSISPLNYLMLASGYDDLIDKYYVSSLVKFKITSGSAEIHAGVGITAFYLMDASGNILYNGIGASENYTLTNNTWYYLYIIGVGNQTYNYTRRYNAKFVGTFNIEAEALAIGYPRSMNCCAENFDGKYFSGAIPMTSDKTSFSEVTFTSAMNGYQAPIGAIVTDTTSISMYNGTSWINTKSFVVNKATGTDALTIFGTAATASNAINIGANTSMAGGSYSVAIGNSAKCNSSSAVAIGRSASVGSNAKDVSAIGYNARIAANANYAIQLGNGQNSTANSLAVGFNNNNYQLLDGTTGLIPSGRIPIDNSTITVNASGQLVASGGSITVDQTYDATSANAQSGVAIAGELANYTLTSSLATVATSGSYADLSNTPTIPTATSDLNNDSGYITSSAITNMQTTTNLVTFVSSSSTDSQYPSAKLFYDTVGNIETLLQAV